MNLLSSPHQGLQ